MTPCGRTAPRRAGMASGRRGFVERTPMAYRDDLIALSARHDALAAEVAQKTRELEESRQLLAQVRARARLPVLDHIRVASPCTADWNQMTGDERTRHCGQCKKDVYNLSGMTRDEAEALLIERNGDLCVRYFQRHDGTILLADCTVGIQRRRRRRWIAAGAATMLAAGAGVAGAVQHSAQATLGALRMPSELPRIEEVVPPLPTSAPHAPAANLGPRALAGRSPHDGRGGAPGGSDPEGSSAGASATGAPDSPHAKAGPALSPSEQPGYTRGRISPGPRGGVRRRE